MPSTIAAREPGPTSTALQEALVPILDHAHRREDRREQQHHHHDAREEVLEVADVLGAAQAERRRQARADHQPEDERLQERAGDAALLAEEADDVARASRTPMVARSCASAERAGAPGAAGASEPRARAASRAAGSIASSRAVSIKRAPSR